MAASIPTPHPRTNTMDNIANKLFSTALYWHERGLISAPFSVYQKNGKWIKRPVIQKGVLEGWLEHGQTLQELKSLPWEKANAVGVFMEKTNDGLYLSCIDIDAPEEFWRPLLKHLPITRLEKTPRGGLHAFYFSEQKPKKTSIDIGDGRRIELLYEKWCLLYPSQNYERLNSNDIRIVEDVFITFMNFLYDAGLDFKKDLQDKADNKEDMENTAVIKEYLRKVEDVLKDKLAYNGSGYALFHCPFHEPDRHPSLYLNKVKGYVHDFHTNESYSLKSFLQKVGALTSEKREKLQEPVKIDVKRFVDALKSVGCIEYIVNPLLPKGALILLVGRPGEGKSFLTLDFCLKIAKGERILESFESQKCNVLLADFENSLSLLKERAAFISENGDIPENLFIWDGDFSIEEKKSIEFLEWAITQYNVKIIFIDNLSAIIKFSKENDNIKIYQLMRKLRNIALKHGVCILIVHHLRKTQPFTGNILDEVRGSSSIVALSDIVLLLEKIQDFFRLRVLKNRINSVFESYILELVKGGFRLLQKGAELSGDRLSAVCRYIESVATSMPNGVFAAKIISGSSPFSNKEIYQGLQFLQGIGKVRRLKRGLYQYVLQTLLTSNEDLDYSE
jgi:archaellum biogenesis ATPase FlaH